MTIQFKSIFFFFFFFFFFAGLGGVGCGTNSLILSRVNLKVGAKTGDPREKPPDHLQGRTWLVSHVTRARLEATVVR